MGKRGPAPTPTKILEVRGSWRAGARQDEPQPEAKRPVCPAWLMPEAKRAWRELAPQLDRMGVLGKCDRNALARYCQTWAKWRAAEEWIMEHGDHVVVRDKDGRATGIVEPPQVGRTIRLADQLLRLEQHFGLTPSARAGLATRKDNPDENRGKDPLNDPRRFFKNG